MTASQNYKNHGRLDPFFHFFLIPVALIDFILAVRRTIHFWPRHQFFHLWWIVMSIVWFFTIALVREYANKNQDRIIRLEERLRYSTVLPAASLAAADALTLKQIISLRFASDAELPQLIQRSVAESLTPKQIKQSIVTWRPDNTRV